MAVERLDGIVPPSAFADLEATKLFDTQSLGDVSFTQFDQQDEESYMLAAGLWQSSASSSDSHRHHQKHAKSQTQTILV
jgi:hypothetical protein